jgi:hypothetical protein
MKGLRLFALSATLLLGCSPPPPAPPAAPPVAPILTLKQTMEWVLDPAADVIWDSVKSIITASGTKEIKPETDEQWTAVRNAAATLTESGSMLMLDGRAKDRGEWVKMVKSLVTNAEQAMKAADAKSVEALFAAGGDVYVSCRTCHQLYAPHLNAAPNGIAPEQLALAAPVARAEIRP